ncbi:MAG TPA: TonB-dependent receptor [Opitutales bacterium]|nr:TonB-dependent receptor [Opitutales bacterium]
MSTPTLTTTRKALTINLDAEKYGTFAEIGAGQEVARHFFQAGGAAGTIAKSMSAYDMTFSDAIYGKSKRYVSRERLYQMIDREFQLLEERLAQARGEKTCFFVFANTVAARNYQGTNECHGWMGIRWQLKPHQEPSEIVVHVRMRDKSNIAQQEALGIFGINLIYGAFYFSQNPDQFIESLADNLGLDRVEVDMIEFNGPDFKAIENRVLSLKLVEKGFTQAVMFSPGGKVLQPSEFLYKKAVLVERGSFRPMTLVNQDMLNCAYAAFSQEECVAGKQDIAVLLEITMNALKSTGQIDYQDFLARVDIIGSTGHNVLISNYFEFYRLTSYFRQFTQSMIGIVLGINTLLQIFNEDYYRNLDGGILESCGRLFKGDLKLYAYPMHAKGYEKYVELRGEQKSQQLASDALSEPLITADNLRVTEHIQDLYSYLRKNGFIEPLNGYTAEHLSIFAPEVLRMIQHNEPGWESMVPEPVAKIIKERHYWNYAEEPALLPEL